MSFQVALVAKRLFALQTSNRDRVKRGHMTLYTFEKNGSPWGSFATQNITEARAYAAQHRLSLIANEYEYSDSELVEDFEDRGIPSHLLENLDGMFPDDLRQYAAELDGLDLSEHPNSVAARDALFEYAMKKSQAMELRANGQIEPAMKLERRCDAVYEQLPKWARW